MKENTSHSAKAILLTLIWALSTQWAQAQSVGIGTTTPNAAAMLDVNSTNKGILIPRVALTATNTAAPLSSFVAGMMVYNTATAGTAPNNVTPGFYFCNGSSWQKAEGGWNLSGNAGTNPANNFIGTTDDQDVVFKRDGIRAGLLNYAQSNTSWGESAFIDNSTGTHNTAIGAAALKFNNNGTSNTALGSRAMFNNTDGFGNVAVGSRALKENNSGSYNVAVGNDALPINKSNFNTAIGGNALFNNVSGYSNVAVGVNSLINSGDRSNLVAVGDSALFSNGLNVTTATQAIENTAVGSKTLFGNTTGSYNTASGYQALKNNNTGTANTASGNAALFTNSTGGNNTANGVQSLYTNSTGFSNTAFGHSSLYSNSTGRNNTAQGFQALFSNTSGYSNVAMGTSALYRNTNRSNIVAIGDSALYNNGVGASSSTDAIRNTALGSKALYLNTTASNNTAVGFQALYSNSTGSSNVAIGEGALYQNQIGERNVVLGNNAGYKNKGDRNVFIGHSAGSENNGNRNVMIGFGAGSAAVNESNKLYIENTLPGIAPLIYGEFDNKNLQVNNKLGIGMYPSSSFPLTIKGVTNGNDGLILFADNTGASKWHMNLRNADNYNLEFVETGIADRRLVFSPGGNIGIGRNPNPINSSRLQIKAAANGFGLNIEQLTSGENWDLALESGTNHLYFFANSNPKAFINATSGAYIQISDARFKKNVETHKNVLANILRLQPLQYQYKDNKNTDPVSTGFMAQDVQKIFPEAVTESVIGGEKILGVNYQYFTVAAIKGLQEQQAIIDGEKIKVKNLEDKLTKLEEMIRSLIKD